MDEDRDAADEGRGHHSRPVPGSEAHGVNTPFEQQARQTPDAVALVQADRSFTYRALNEQANRLAHLLIGRGVGRGDRVGLAMPRSAECVVAMLGVMKAGAAYVPLEPGLPLARAQLMIEENRIGLLVVAPDSGTAPDLSGTGVPLLEPWAAGVDAQPSTDPGVPVAPEDIMYVLYTSGSTGAPKGTEVPHSAVTGFFAGEDYAYWGPGAVIVHHSALSWDGHVFDLFPALVSGGTVVVFDGDAGDPVAVARHAAECRATVLWLTAAAFNTVVDVDPSLLSGLKHLLTGGETLSAAHVARALRALPDTRLINGYGPSECTCLSTVHPLTAEDAADTGAGIPIGRPVGDRAIHLLDPHGAPVPDGTRGELYVGGPGVARGYLARPALTAETFVPDRFSGVSGARLYRTGDLAVRRPDGLLAFAGRTDDQVKIRGFRVEPGEVEQQLRRHPGVRDAVVLPRRATDGQCLDLTAYVVTAGPGSPSPATLRAHVRRDLPSVMVPGAVVLLERLPLTANGKVDKRALPQAGADDQEEPADYAEPVGDTERYLSEVWEELLGTRAGRDHDFFALGGQSLLASRMAARLRTRYGVELPLRALYRASRLADMATEVDRLRTTTPASQPAVAIARVARVPRSSRNSPAARP